jgi:GH24 family phage-related lysozyme (muramidase)
MNQTGLESIDLKKTNLKLQSFAYNLGARFYGSSGFNTITRVLKNKEWDKVPDALKLYRNPGTNVEAGLLRRRVAEGKLWMS